MSFRRISIGQLGSMYTDLVVIDRYSSEIVFFSAVSYNSLVQASLKELKKNNNGVFISGVGSWKIGKQGYEVESKKDQDNAYTHCIAFARDKINYKEDGSEEISIYIYCKSEDEFIDKLYAKISKYSSVPLLEEWKNYLYKGLNNSNRIKRLWIDSKYDKDPFFAYKIDFNKNAIKNIIQTGLKNKEINIKSSNEPSPILAEIKGLNDYLASFGEILAEKIQTAFKPKFVPGEDKYDKFTNYVDDFMFKEANIEMLEAQKSVIQAVVNDLKTNSATFVIAEMGSGKTLMGAAIPYVANANRSKGYNSVVVCPSHLTKVWKREVEERIPNSRAYIIKDFKELKILESKLRNKKKIENSYVILSKERAKMSYDKRPAAIWSRSKNTFVCPECGQPLYTIEYEGSGRNRRINYVSFNKLSMTKQLASNTRCMNSIRKWNNKKQRMEIVPCNASLWQPLNRDDQNHKWFKLGSEGWIYKEHIVELTETLMEKETLSKKENALFIKLMEQYELIQAGELPFSSYKGAKKYSIAKYIRERMKNVFDYCIVDECHEAKGLTEQGQAVADLISASKKSILLTGTLLNGYADGLYYLLWRAVPKLMKKEGFKFSDEAEFARMYGVHSKESRFEFNNGVRGRKVGSTKEKRLPGVSPLVFTKFLLEHAVFLSLSDMSNALPGYEEIPVPVMMDYDLSVAYNHFEEAFRNYAKGRGSKKCMGPFLQSLTTFPDCPHIVSPIIDPDTGTLIYNPEELPKQQREKETALLNLVQERLEAGEKVMVFYSWVNKTDIGESLIDMFAQNGIKACEMKSSIEPDKREDWVNKQLEKGMDVLICNPKLVETGLTLLDFTSIIFYQMGYNLFTMRQASRRSWRLSQTKDVKVYFMYYETSIQEQTLSLMATKLQAAMALEGKFSEEGLRAMSNNEDLLTQIANNVVEGIKDTVNQDIFKATAFIKSKEVKGRNHPTPSNILKFKFNEDGMKSVFTYKQSKIIPNRRIIDINEDLLNNPISLFC